ncbi:hypothetical protein [Streptosporangium sp. NPDC051022]|uniref:hypothetical protein n=1 Tax=Streptosporangium sp. NPDC051022 TaxID=3155752 RepID=UPI003422905F
MGGSALVVAAPFTASPPAGASARLAANPSEVPGCDVDPAGPCAEPTPVVTVTVTDAPPAESPLPVPQKTVTTTVTVTPSSKPKPPKTKPPKTTAPQPTPLPVQPPVSTPVVPAPVETPASTPTEEAPVFPSTEEVQPTPTPTPDFVVPSSTPQPTGDDTFEDPGAASVPYEIRNAGSDFNASELSQQLGIPALILVLLVLFAVLIFEGRLRRMAHASAVRRAGPRGAGRREYVETMPYPPGAAYAPAPGFPPTVYQGGTAYAPIISFVPMQMYGGTTYPEGYAPEQHPQAYEQPIAYMPGPGQEQPTGYFDQQHGHFPAGHDQQSPYGPAGPGTSQHAFQEGSSRFPEETLQPGPGEFPAGPFDQGFGGFPGASAPQGTSEFPAGSPDQGFGGFPAGPAPEFPAGPPSQGFGDFPGAQPQGFGGFPGASAPQGTSEFPAGPPQGTSEFPAGPPQGFGEFSAGPVQGAGEFPGAPFPQEPARRPFGLEPLPSKRRKKKSPSSMEPPAAPPTAPSEESPSGSVWTPPSREEPQRRPFGLEPLPDKRAKNQPSSDESSGTAVYPLPGEKDDKKKRGLFRRSK